MAVTPKENRGPHGALALGSEFSCGPPLMGCTIIALWLHGLVLTQALTSHPWGQAAAPQDPLGPGYLCTSGSMPLWHLALCMSLGAQVIAVKTRT